MVWAQENVRRLREQKSLGNKALHLKPNDSQQRWQKHSGEDTVSSANGVGRTGYPHGEDWNLTFIFHLVWIKGLNIHPETLQVLEEK
jgi:hypothetical protein